MKNIATTTIVLFVGIVILILGAHQNIRYENAIAEGFTVEATVTKVDEDEDLDPPHSITYTLYGDYEVDGKEYKNKKLTVTATKYVVGDKYEVVVNNTDGKVLVEGGIFITLGFVMTVGAIVCKVKERKKEKEGNGGA